MLSFLWRTPTSVTSCSAALSFWPLRLVLSCMYHFQNALLEARSLIRVMQWMISRSHCSGPTPCLLLMLMNWAISQTRSRSLFSFHCVVDPPCSCQISMVSAAYWLTPTPTFSAQTRTGRVGICIVLASATNHFGNQKASHYISGSQQWSMIEWWTSNARDSRQASGVLTTSSRETRFGSRGAEDALKVLEIVSKVGRQGEWIYGLGGVFLIRRHHLGC